LRFEKGANNVDHYISWRAWGWPTRSKHVALIYMPLHIKINVVVLTSVLCLYISRTPASLEANWCRTVKYAGITGGTLKRLICVRACVTCSFHTFTTARIFIRPWLRYYSRMGINTWCKSKTVEKMQAFPVLKDGEWRK
jgi:hypothetical protein